MKIYIVLALVGALCTTAAPTHKHHFRFLGVDESGAEFGGQNLPGTLGTDYIWPSTTSINVC
jgi:endoglucanase